MWFSDDSFKQYLFCQGVDFPEDDFMEPISLKVFGVSGDDSLEVIVFQEFADVLIDNSSLVLPHCDASDLLRL